MSESVEQVRASQSSKCEWVSRASVSESAKQAQASSSEFEQVRAAVCPVFGIMVVHLFQTICSTLALGQTMSC